MILQSDNVESKRPKHSFSPIRNEIKQEDCEEEEEEDIISGFPDEILTHILSFLPGADAYRTRILSNRWNHLFFFLPSLCFKMPDPHKQSVEAVNKFYDFVDKTFSIRNRDMPVIKRFFLSCSGDYDHNRVLGWLRIVLHSKHVETLELRFPSEKDRFSLSWNLLKTCDNTLIDLTLENVKLVGLDETQLVFPCLKTLNLESIKYTGDESLENLISACPVLQELFLIEPNFESELDTFKIISSPSLKRLRIQWCVFGQHEVVIDAPKLEYFYVSSPFHKSYSLTNPCYLVEAHINIYSHSDINVFTSVSSARILTLTSASFLGLRRNDGLNLTVFPNLVKLIVDFDDIREWNMLFILLNNMPNLQYITILFGYRFSPYKRRWQPPTEAPACLRFMVKEVVILNQDPVQVEDYVTLIRYLLRHSSVLEKLTSSTFDIDREKREKLLKVRRISKSRMIEFV